MAETEEERASRAQQIAYTQGRRDADVDSHLRSHEKRLNAINGSVSRTATALEQLTDEVRQIKSDLKERDTVNEALVTAATGRGAKRLTRLQSAGIIAMASIALLSLVVTIVQALGH